MGEAEKDSQTKLDETREEADSPGGRRVYATPEVTVLELASVVKGTSGKKMDMGVPAKP
jgi:hypothetical protein